MVRCSECGRENPGDAQFCNRCGAELAGGAPHPRAVRKVVTVLFCDITASTALADRADPEAVRAVLARYYARMREVIERHGGTVEKFIGDAVMAVFGVPRVHEDDALRAVRAAVEMRAALVELGIPARIGVNTGEVVAHEDDALVTGDVVNVAARLEQSAASGEVLIGAATHRMVRGAVLAEEVGPLLLKGKEERVPAWRLVELRPEAVTSRSPGVGRGQLAAMVGRETELRRLRDVFDQAVSDRSCQLVTVLGTAGVGKSRLVAEFASGVEEARMVRGRCLSYGEGITYWPLAEVLRELPDPRELGLDARAVEAIAAIDGETSQPGGSTEEIAWGVRKLLERIAAERPVVVAFEDIHWAEPTLLDMIEHVVDLSRDAPVLVVCTARPELLERRAGWAGGKFNATSLLLEPLSSGEADELVAHLTDGDALDEGQRARITEAAEGNPLFVEEMVALVRESGVDRIGAPPTISALLAARLDQLQPADRSLLEQASVEGRVFHVGGLAATAGGDPEPGTPARLAGLVRKELIRPDRGQLAGEDAFRFRHALIRDVAYDAIPKARRALLHERFAGWLEHRTDGRELGELVGYHLERAYNYRVESETLDVESEALAARAGILLAAAGRRALDRGDLMAGANLLARAGALVPANDPARIELLVELGNAQLAGGRIEQAEPTLTAALAAAEAAGDERLEQHAALALAGLGHWRNRIATDQVRAAAERAIGVFAASGDHLGLARAHSWLAECENHVGNNAGRRAQLEQALVDADAAGAVAQAGQILTFLPVTFTYDRTPAQEAIRRLEEFLKRPALGLAARLITLGSLAHLYAMRERFDEAFELLDQARSIGEEFGLTFQLARMRDLSAAVYLLNGDPAGAERELGESCAAFEAMGERGRLCSDLAYLASVIFAQGRVGEAEAWVVRARALSLEDDANSLIGCRQVEALILAARERHDEAERLAREAVALTDPENLAHRPFALLDLAEVLRLGGNPSDAAAQATDALALLEQKGNLAGASQARAFLDALAAPSSPE